jgi:hypothetical protein
MPADNETWIIEAGDEILEREAADGEPSLTPIDRLIYCLWVADYGMRNAGDLITASDLYASFQSEALQVSTDLGLVVTQSAFSLSSSDLEAQYFQRFDAICDEIRAAQQARLPPV